MSDASYIAIEEFGCNLFHETGLRKDQGKMSFSAK